MDDRGLLELAAKAAGYQVDTGFADCPLIYGEDAGPDGPREWNPLEDDGDALRLAVRLGITIGSTENAGYAECDDERQVFIRQPTDAADRAPYSALEATRRAIVRAAAEIGRAM